MYYINRAFFIATEHNRVGGRKVEWYIMQTTMVAVFTFPPSFANTLAQPISHTTQTKQYYTPSLEKI